MMNALFGKEGVQFTRSGTKEIRIPDGVWVSKSGPRYTRISAVLLATKVMPWNISKALVRLYHNPWAQRPYASVLNCLPRAIPEGSIIIMKEGDTLAKIFNLPPEWPTD